MYQLIPFFVNQTCRPTPQSEQGPEANRGHKRESEDSDGSSNPAAKRAKTDSSHEAVESWEKKRGPIVLKLKNVLDELIAVKERG
jgi:hypothetical protein